MWSFKITKDLFFGIDNKDNFYLFHTTFEFKLFLPCGLPIEYGAKEGLHFGQNEILVKIEFFSITIYERFINCKLDIIN